MPNHIGPWSPMESQDLSRVGTKSLRLDMIIKPQSDIQLNTPFYYVARFVNQTRRDNVPSLIKNGTCGQVSVRVILFIWRGSVRERPADGIGPKKRRDRFEMYPYDLEIGRDFHVGVLTDVEHTPPGEYMAFKLCFSEPLCFSKPGKAWIRFELQWKRGGKEYRMWHVAPKVRVGGDVSVAQRLTRYEQSLVKALVPDPFPPLPQNPACERVYELLREQDQAQRKEKDKASEQKN
ncbi:hypothetical protein GGR58DRAFT_500816 [Xylaria digitata]|nr:hypothetical protein GGR58DRAFT_500816 [Xylaria digitata]